jgi:hypothetical protein
VRVVPFSIGVLATVGLLAVTAAEPAQGRSSVVVRAGITAVLPEGWRVVDRRLTPCTDPVERLTVVGHGAMVMLQERLRSDDGLPSRPHRFELRGAPQPLECCAPLRRAGWSLRFSEAGRGIYGYVYLGGRKTRTEALAILDSLRFTDVRR